MKVFLASASERCTVGGWPLGLTVTIDPEGGGAVVGVAEATAGEVGIDEGNAVDADRDGETAGDGRLSDDEAAADAWLVWLLAQSAAPVTASTVRPAMLLTRVTRRTVTLMVISHRLLWTPI